jgi:hypothetical protein
MGISRSTFYDTPDACARDLTIGRGIYCLSVGAVQVDQAVAQAALAALAPIGIEASATERRFAHVAQVAALGC